MAGRPKLYDEEQALDKAIEVFWEKGYEGASSEELLKAMGIGKGSFYLAYKEGKQELFEKSIDRFFARYPAEFLTYLKTLDNPLEAIKGYFYTMSSPDSPFYIRGCYFGNTVVQAEDSSLKVLASKQILVIADAFVEALNKGKQLGYVKFDMSDELLSLYLINLWNGLNVTRHIEKDPHKLNELIDAHFKIFD